MFNRILRPNEMDFEFFNTLCLNFSYGANWNPKDGGSLPIIAMLDKLVESPYAQLHVESCLKILLKTVPSIEMAYKVHALKLQFQITNSETMLKNFFLFLDMIAAIYLRTSKRDFHSEIWHTIRARVHHTAASFWCNGFETFMQVRSFSNRYNFEQV